MGSSVNPEFQNLLSAFLSELRQTADKHVPGNEDPLMKKTSPGAGTTNLEKPLSETSQTSPTDTMEINNPLIIDDDSSKTADEPTPCVRFGTSQHYSNTAPSTNDVVVSAKIESQLRIPILCIERVRLPSKNRRNMKRKQLFPSKSRTLRVKLPKSKSKALLSSKKSSSLDNMALSKLKAALQRRNTTTSEKMSARTAESPVESLAETVETVVETVGNTVEATAVVASLTAKQQRWRNKWIRCSDCDAKMKTQHALIQHMKIHRPTPLSYEHNAALAAAVFNGGNGGSSLPVASGNELPIESTTVFTSPPQSIVDYIRHMNMDCLDSSSDREIVNGSEVIGSGSGTRTESVLDTCSEAGSSSDCFSKTPSPRVLPHQRHHPLLQRVICFKCKIGFPEAAAYERHRQLEHKDEWQQEEEFNNADPDSEPVQKCTVCAYEDPDPHAFAMHTCRSQSVAKPFLCNVCRKAYRKLQHLNAHKNLHADIHPVSCQYCAMTFNSSIHRRIHETEQCKMRPKPRVRTIQRGHLCQTELEVPEWAKQMYLEEEEALKKAKKKGILLY